LLTIKINVFFLIVSLISLVVIIIFIYFIFPYLRLSTLMKICIENLIKFFINCWLLCFFNRSPSSSLSLRDLLILWYLLIQRW
jgi:hypothetical protein